MYIGPHAQHSYYGPVLIALEFSRRIFEKYSNIKFHENSCNGSRVVSCEQTDGRTKLVVVFRKFAKVHEKDTENFQTQPEIGINTLSSRNCLILDNSRRQPK